MACIIVDTWCLLFSFICVSEGKVLNSPSHLTILLNGRNNKENLTIPETRTASINDLLSPAGKFTNLLIFLNKRIIQANESNSSSIILFR